MAVADLDTPANRKKAKALPAGARPHWADLTDPAAVDRLVSEVSPSVIVHLAAIIPPPLYRNPGLARKVNVDATVALVRAAEAQPEPPRFVQASSNAVYGSRNPHRVTDVVRADTPTRPIDVYSATKLEAEEYVRASGLEWVVLRLGAVLSPDFSALPLSADGIFIESALPTDNRIHTVDVRDVATAFATATTADVAREILLIAGDDSHKLLQKDVGPALAAALGLPGVLPEGRPGDPDNDDGWFLTDWMDTERAQQALGFQHHSWPAHARRDARADGLEALPAAASSPRSRGCSSRAVPPTAMHPAATPTCGVRFAPGWVSPVWTRSGRAVSRGPAGTCRSAGCGTTRWRPVFHRRHGWSDPVM